MAVYPKLDLPVVADDLDVRLQSAHELERIHDESEQASYFYPIAHHAITSVAKECIDSPGLVIATDLGVAAFEAIGHNVEPDRTYRNEADKVVVAVSAERFIGYVEDADLYSRAMEEALGYMKADTPRLTETLTEILGRYVRYDPVSLRFALQGAAAIRGMQIFVDTRLAKMTG